MKITLLTLWHVKNYGAELQTYATVKALKLLGCEVEVLDFRLSDTLRPSFLGKIALFVEALSPMNRNFRNFWRKYIPSSKRYRSPEKLLSNPPIADIYMVGSDQVWNPDITGSHSISYFLDFGPSSVRRISYASSFGVDVWKYNNLHKDVKTLLKRFDFVTCREETGVRLLKEQFNIDAINVVDPTLLFPLYPEFATPKLKPYLVFYPLTEDKELERLSIKVSTILGLKVFNNNSITKIFGKISWNRISVQDWVKNIAESQFVITRSFHGLVFSILYNKQFAMLKIKNGRNSRVENLLKKVGLEDRVYDSPENLLQDKPWERVIDYSIVNSRIAELREDSWKILKSMLGYER